MPAWRKANLAGTRRPVEHGMVAVHHAATASCLLFCFHHAGAGASIFRNWPRLLDPAIGVATVQLPGRENAFGTPLLTDPETAVERIGNEVADHAHRPYALFGHSLGAMLAFEVAAAIEAHNTRAPSCLIVSGHPPLQLKREHATPASQLSDDEFVAMLRRYGGTPTEVLDNPDLQRLLLPIIRADFRLAEAHRLPEGRRVSCPILVLAGREDATTNSSDLMRWGELTEAGTSVQMFDGGHFFIRSHERQVCETIGGFLRCHTMEGSHGIGAP